MTKIEQVPIFSRTPQKAKAESFNPEVASTQASFAKCRACLDTGTIDGKRCWCQREEADQ